MAWRDGYIFPGINWLTYLGAIDQIKNFKSLQGKGKCKIYSKNNAVILELSGKNKGTTLREQYKKISKLTLKLSGSQLKDKRKKRLDEQLITTLNRQWLKGVPKYDKKGYKDPATNKFYPNPLRDEKKEELINEALENSSDITDKSRKREDARQRKIYQRNKHRLQ